MNRFVVLALLVAGCATQPDYQRPAVELPQAWKESAPRFAVDGRWWKIYADPVLDTLVDEALVHNTDVALAVARVDEARALLGVTESRVSQLHTKAILRLKARLSSSMARQVKD